MNKGLLILLGVVGFVAIAIAVGRQFQPPQVEPETTEVETQAGDVQESKVLYTETGFLPRTLSVALGTKVTFVNETDKPMWVASDPHPVHTDYSQFDQLGDGETYTFTFSEVGTYSYHNHMVPQDTGTVVVE